MRKKIIFILYVLLNSGLSLAQVSDTSAEQYKPVSENYNFIGGWPVAAGLFGGKNLGLRNVLILGLEFSYGKVYNNVLLGTKLAYAHTHIQGLKGSNKAIWSIYSEYHFLPRRKVRPLVGLQTYVVLFQYTPEVGGYQFFNDSLDGTSRTRLMPGIKPYLGLDFLLGKRSHIVLSYGYDYIITNKPGRILVSGKQGMDWNLEFRMSLHRRK